MSTATPEEIHQVFDYWVDTVKVRSHLKPKMDQKRYAKVKQAVEAHGVQVCLDAIDGLLLSAWHLGENPRGKRYDDISLILRDNAHIERFATIKYDRMENGFDLSEEPFNLEDES